MKGLNQLQPKVVKMKISILFQCLLFLCSNDAFCQANRYHEYRQTASDFEIVRWNIPKDSLANFNMYVAEIADGRGRVTELRFLENGGLSKERLCYLPDMVKYEYPTDNIIVETLYNADGSKMIGLECEVYYKTTYKLDENMFILKAQIEYFADSAYMKQNGFSDEDIKTEMDFVKASIFDPTTNADAAKFVRFYLKSYSKLNRKFPVSKSFAYYGWPEKDAEEIDARKCLVKHRK